MTRYSEKPAAMARIRGDRAYPCLRGLVKFYQRRGGVLIVAEVSGLPGNGFHGFHIHEGAACTGMDFADSGAHYNPAGQLHPMHAGDLPQLLSAGGRAYLAALTDRFSIRDVIGRAVIIHADPDDFHTQPSGNAGAKIACGIIQPLGGKRI